MHRASIPINGKQPVYKIVLLGPDNETIEKTYEPFNSIVEAKVKLRELGNPLNGWIRLIDA